MTALLRQTRKLLLTPAGFALALAAASVGAVVLLMAMMLGDGVGAGDRPPAFRLASEAELRALAPTEIAGIRREDIKVETAVGANVPAVGLAATYREGARRVDLEIVQSSALEQVVGFGGADTAAYDRTSTDSYQRRWRDAGVIFVESLDRSSGEATFGRVSRNLYVMAHGQSGVSIDQLRAAVSQIGDGALPAPKGGG